MTRSTVHDDIQGTTYWPGSYDGRAIVGEPYREHLAGLPIEDNAERYKKAKAAGETNWLVNWAYVFYLTYLTQTDSFTSTYTYIY
jgi:hypothetical protein